MKSYLLFLAGFYLMVSGCTAIQDENNKNNTDMETTQGTPIKIHGNQIHTVGVLPPVGTVAKNFTLIATDLSEKSLSDYKGKFIVLNIFPSIDTDVCAASVRKFNQDAASLDNTVVLCISKDLPFAQKRFCAAEGIKNVVTLSDFRTDFGHQYGVQLADGPLKGVLSRAVIVVNPEGKIIYTEQVPEITQEPDYTKALATLK